MLKIPQKIQRDLKNKHYGIAGNHSAVQICEWTKRSLWDKGDCYKHQFYGVETYSCSQVSPNAIWCDQNCIFCWRPAENMLKEEIKDEVDNPKETIDKLVTARYKLLSGFKGQKGVNKEKVKITLNEFPSHWAISLSGEPTLYPKLGEFIKELKKRDTKSIFVVSNGQNPDVIKKLEEKDSLPTQLYISLDAWDKDSYDKINRGIRKDAWQRLLKTLRLLKNLTTRTVIRLTVIKGMNDSEKAIKEFGKLFEIAQPDFLEIKSYMFLGYSRKRLKEENMPDFEYLKRFAKNLEKYIKSMAFEDENVPSRILLYMNNGKNRTKAKPSRWIIHKEKWRF